MTAGTALQTAARQRAVGRAVVRFGRRGAKTVLADLEQGGALRVLFPRGEADAQPSAVLANIGGGIAGGDRLEVDLRWEAGADAVATTQAAEKVYRALDEAAAVATRLDLGAGAVGHWLPQETILFDDARLARSLDVAVAGDAELLACESLVFGRTARGERVVAGHITDRWRIRRDGRLVFAETFALDGPIAGSLGRPAIGGGAVAAATALLVAPDAEARLTPLRDLLAGLDAEAGASAFDGCLVVRFLSPSASILRRDVGRTLVHLGRRPLPRVFAF